jgi:hypothetical protein
MNEPRVRGAPESNNLWVLRVRILLQRSLDDIDASSRSRLNQARQAALKQLRQEATGATWPRWIGATAVAAGMVVMLWHGIPAQIETDTTTQAVMVEATDPSDANSPVIAPDFDLLADEAQFDLVQNLEFYAWLEASEENEG